jgi:hypothetical protein
MGMAMNQELLAIINAGGPLLSIRELLIEHETLNLKRAAALFLWIEEVLPQ